MENQDVLLALSPALFPLVCALVSQLVSSETKRPLCLPITGIGNLILVALCIARSKLSPGQWFGIDPVGKIVLITLASLFACVSIYMVGYLRLHPRRPNRVFCGTVLVLIAMLNLATLSQHLGVMWLAIETGTLAAAPLIYFNRKTTSLEATWKYLMVGGVGVGFALLGTFFLAYATIMADVKVSLLYPDLVMTANSLPKFWLRIGFILLLVGYGTKLGLAPMHTWKPDTYGEVSGAVGALLAGGMTNCAFLALIRAHHICKAAGEGHFSAGLLLFLGLVSMFIAGVFMIKQQDFKRLLAYSSVEHMGLLVISLALGGNAFFGGLLHVLFNGLTKGIMFLSAENIQFAFASKKTIMVQGALYRTRFSAIFFLLGFLAIVGTPPFAPFLSEYYIIKSALCSEAYWRGIVVLALLLLVFLAMGKTVMGIVFGAPLQKKDEVMRAENTWTILPIAILAAVIIIIGIGFPKSLQEIIVSGVNFVESQAQIALTP